MKFLLLRVNNVVRGKTPSLDFKEIMPAHFNNVVIGSCTLEQVGNNLFATYSGKKLQGYPSIQGEYDDTTNLLEIHKIVFSLNPNKDPKVLLLRYGL